MGICHKLNKTQLIVTIVLPFKENLYMEQLDTKIMMYFSLAERAI